jgi:hypothetical protein
MADKTTSKSKHLKSRNVRKKGWVERSPIGGIAKNTSSKVKNLKGSIGGVFVGILFVLIGFFLIYGSVKWVKNNSSIVEQLQLQSASDISPDAGMAKINGDPRIQDEDFAFEYTKCFDEFCFADEQSEEALTDLLYYSVTYERYEQYEKKETKKEVKDTGSEEITEEYEVIEIKEGWKEKGTKNAFAKFQIGDIEIDPSDATSMLDTDSRTIENIILPGDIGDDDYIVEGHEEEASDKVGRTRMVLKTVSPDDEVIVVGEVSNGNIEGGEPFIITNYSDSKLLDSLETAEKSGRLMIRIGAWVMLTLGFLLIIGPILALADFIPVVGGAARGLAFFLSAILALIIVIMGVLIVKFWWLFLLILLAGGGLGIYLLVKKRK